MTGSHGPMLDPTDKNWQIEKGVETSVLREPKVMICSRKKFCVYFIAMLFIGFVVPLSATSASPDVSAPWRYSLFFENDTFFNTDYLYTSGIKISAASPSASSWEELGYLPKKVLPFVKKLPLINSDIDHYSLTYSMGQVIYTPEDTDRVEPSPEDRPYAGAAFLECGLNALGGNRLTSAGFVLGIAGPHSYAEKTQTEVHGLAHVYSSSSFKEQPSGQTYGALHLSVAFLIPIIFSSKIKYAVVFNNISENHSTF